MIATDIRPGDTVAYCGETFTVLRRTFETVPGLWRLETVEPGPPQYIAPEREVEPVRLAPRPTPPDPKPFKVYTRYYKASGDCEKRIHSFATERARSAFIRTTKRVVTFVP